MMLKLCCQAGLSVKYKYDVPFSFRSSFKQNFLIMTDSDDDFIESTEEKAKVRARDYSLSIPNGHVLGEVYSPPLPAV